MTDTTRRRRPGRPRASESPLTRQSILTAALALVDEQGIEALSMRRLAAALKVDPMSIYYHVPNKAALVSGLVQTVFSEMALPAPGGSWTVQVRAWARAYRDLALAHPNLVLQIVTDAAAVSEAAILVSEPLYAALDSAGLGARAVVDSANTLIDFVNGYALALAEGATSTSPSAGGGSMGERLAAMDPDQVPTMCQVHDALKDEQATSSGFEAGLDIIIRGIS